jgi:hypothetical protein
MAVVAVLTACATAGCSIGEGSPDGWRYLRTGSVAVALPKTWRVTGSGAALPGSHGRTDAVLTVTVTGGRNAAGSSQAQTQTQTQVPAPARAAAPDGGVPAGARRRTLTLDGRHAQVLTFTRAAPDGRPACHLEVRVQDRAGHTVTVHGWVVGAPLDSILLKEIVNSIEFPRP